MKKSTADDTICALATAHGVGAIAIVRISGSKSKEILSSVFKSQSGSDLSSAKSHRMHYGAIFNGDKIVDEVLVTLFKAPHSFTGEDSAEIYCHGSLYIQNEIILLLISKGARLAKPGEYSQRAFLNGKMDLAQAEAVADLIASENESSHRIAMQQMRGGFSGELSKMRESLLNLVSLMELELDFSEEDVEFADRTQLYELLNKTSNHIAGLIESFKLGNVIKNGVPVAIVGATNTGKSTLLNAILGEERAIVSEIHGTTRDFIEDVVNISGVAFRFVDTAGIRKTKEEIEIIGIERTYEKIKSASVVVLMLDPQRTDSYGIGIKELASRVTDNQLVIILLNKTENLKPLEIEEQIKMIKLLAASERLNVHEVLAVSAKNKIGLEKFKTLLSNSQNNREINSNMTLVSNVRHYEALKLAFESLERVREGMDDSLPTDLLTQDIREALFHIGEIVGEVNTEEILGNIFSKFCIGK